MRAMGQNPTEGDSDINQLKDAEFKEAFDEFDTDKSGAISHMELLGVMRAMGQNPTEDELLNMILEVDVDGNGTIEFPEFLELMKMKAKEDDDAETIREAFKLFDRDQDGYITCKELKKVTTMLGQPLSAEEVDEFMAEADVDQNGKLDYDEFSRMLLREPLCGN